MSLFSLIVYFVASFFLILLNNLIGNKSISYGYQTTIHYTNIWSSNGFNLVYRILVPLVFIIIISIPLKLANQIQLIKHIYYVVIFYFVERFFIIVILGRIGLVPWTYEVFIAIVTSYLGKLISDNFISTPEFLPSAQGMSDQIWFLVIIFVYTLINEITVQNNKSSQYHTKKLNRFIKKYGSIIDSKTSNNIYKSVIYGIMINEDFNRPYLVRHVFERILFVFNKAHTTGIMQVKANKYLSDKQSVDIATSLIIDKLSQEISISQKKKNLEQNKNRKQKKFQKRYFEHDTELEKYSSEVINTIQYYNKTASCYELLQLITDIYQKIV